MLMQLDVCFVQLRNFGVAIVETPNEDEAVQVRAIYDLYLEHGSALTVCQEVQRRGWTKRRWLGRGGRELGGRSFNKNSLYGLLTIQALRVASDLVSLPAISITESYKRIASVWASAFPALNLTEMEAMERYCRRGGSRNQAPLESISTTSTTTSTGCSS